MCCSIYKDNGSSEQRVPHGSCCAGWTTSVTRVLYLPTHHRTDPHRCCTHPPITEWTPTGAVPIHPSQNGPPHASWCLCRFPALLSTPAPSSSHASPYLTGPPARLRSFCCAPQAKATGALPVPTCPGRKDSQTCLHPWGLTNPCAVLHKTSSPLPAPPVETTPFCNTHPKLRLPLSLPQHPPI